MKRFIVILTLLLSVPAYADASIIRSHAISLTGTPKYAADADHFDYANPDAPKGGTLKQANYGTYDSFNPFAIKGASFGAVINSVYESLLAQSGEDSLTFYGLIAREIEYPSDYAWVIFHLDKNARWQDGAPITAADVAFSYEELVKVNPFYRDYYALVEKAEILDKHRIKFHFKESNRELPATIGQMAIIPKHWWSSRDLSKSSLEIPVGSGPYRIVSFEAGKNVVLERDKNYWGANLPVNKGMYNFDKKYYEYFRDQTVAFEAFKAGHFDIFSEGSHSRWHQGYTGKYIDAGYIVKKEIPHNSPVGMGGIALNISYAPLNNARVRKALLYVFDYDWINKNLYYGQNKRYDSYFSNSELECGTVPTPKVVDVLKKIKPDASEELLYGEFKLPSSDGSGNNRENLITAIKLFEEAGYKLKNGKLTDPQGKPVYLEILTASKGVESELLNFKKALERVGIEFFVRYVDSSQYMEKVWNKEYMMLYVVQPQFNSPGNEQQGMWTSASANEGGTRNYAKVSDPAVDKLVAMIIGAENRNELVTYTKALDRLLLYGYYFIPAGYSDRIRIAFWDKFDMPENWTDYGVIINSWWVNSEKEKKISNMLSR